MKTLEDTIKKITIACTKKELWCNFLEWAKDGAFDNEPQEWGTLHIIFRDVFQALCGTGETNVGKIRSLFKNGYTIFLLGPVAYKLEEYEHYQITIVEKDKEYYIKHEDINY